MVYLNIGTNLGERNLNLSRAVARIAREFGAFRLSHAVESEPWGFNSPNKFMNVCMAIDTDLEPEMLLDRLQSIEREFSPDSHRNADGSYADRLIDIDIVAIDTLRIDTPRLKVPHPHLHDRTFFSEPLAELAPELIDQLRDTSAN